jgi:hypothetical protein
MKFVDLAAGLRALWKVADRLSNAVHDPRVRVKR